MTSSFGWAGMRLPGVSDEIRAERRRMLEEQEQRARVEADEKRRAERTPEYFAAVLARLLGNRLEWFVREIDHIDPRDIVVALRNKLPAR